MWSVFFVFLSYLDRDLVWGDLLQSPGVDTEKQSKALFSIINGTLCAKMSTAPDDRFLVYQVSDGGKVVRSVVSVAGGEMVDCSVTVDSVEVERFVCECRLGAEGQESWVMSLDASFTHMDEAKMRCARFQGEDIRGPSQVLRRSRRGFTYPGTLWCGAGNMADHYEQLGRFKETDSCCRTHDHCAHVIHAFSSKYGYTNFKWYSISHCDCDEALRGCLRQVNDTSSRVMGQAFFNVIGVPCFELVYEEQCAEHHWYGLCKRYEKFPIAVLKEAVPYDYGGISVIDVVTRAPPITKDTPDTNVVTVAEDFIKVLATVSTSQSSSADKQSESQEKKKKKKQKKKKKKGKGRKRKQKVEEAPLSNFISESDKHDPMAAQRPAEGPNQPSNEVLEDQAVVKTTLSPSRPAGQTSRPSVKNSPSRTGRRKEKFPQPALSTTTITIPTSQQQSPHVRPTKVKRNRSKDGGDIVSHQTVTTELSPRTDVFTAGAPTFSVPTKQRSREKGRRNKRMKAASPLFRDPPQNVRNLTLTTRHMSGGAKRVRWSHVPQAMMRNTTKPRKKAMPTAVSLAEFPPLTSTPAPTPVQTSKLRAPTSFAILMSPMQRSIERVKEQFAWKKRRKAALTIKPH
ncbi:uncharacterized protein proca1 isoform X1 [Nerophis lumbriciformis]|uniref:uncharacterized protein proca1 isoform X1 n=1 Tax=Nerophis lumbriciformis TaxID=546530 RepID=UPI002ADFBE9A|nr:uncharacterized protein LOC133614543 isoform X1 [Nerophis lumbriciformis]